MSETADGRIEEIKRRRSLKAANAALTSIVAVQLLFASFAIGHSLGPSPMRRLELVAGIALSFLIGVALSLPMVRRRLEAGSKARADLIEGRHRRRVLLFEDHVLIDQEVVMLKDLEAAEREGDRLILRYEDPVHGGPVLRELEGASLVLDKVERRLRRARRKVAAS